MDGDSLRGSVQLLNPLVAEIRITPLTLPSPTDKLLDTQPSSSPPFRLWRTRR